LVEEDKAPLLLELIFGEEASTAWREADERLLFWAEAFEEWLAERAAIYKPGTTKQAKLSVRRLLRNQNKIMLWELKQEDMEGHRDWMAAEGYAASTIYNDLGVLANFFRWCDERRIDPACEPGFNPAAGVKRPKIKRYDGVQLLSKSEIDALLWVLRQDESALGKRDYAFILARLKMGAPLEELQKMQWAEVEQERGEIEVSGEVQEAIRAYLEAAGRLEGMKASDYVFAPLAEPGAARDNDRADDWVGERPVSQSALLASLKLYGRLARIPEEKLTMRVLRRTAVRLRLNDGESISGIKTFLHSREEARFTKYRLGKLPQMPDDEEPLKKEEVEAPDRKAKPFKLGEGVIHGYYMKDQPEAEVLAVMAEDIQGIGEEIAGLRRLARGLVARQKGATNRKEAVKVAEVHSRAAARLSEMVEAEKRLKGDEEEDEWVEKNLAMLDEMAMVYGEEPVSKSVLAAVGGSDAELGLDSRSLMEEIASVRYMLRNVLAAALGAEALADYMRMVEIYGSGCVRLVRMVKREKGDMGRLRKYLEEAIERAVKEVLVEWEWVGDW
jgi:integrase